MLNGVGPVSLLPSSGTSMVVQEGGGSRDQVGESRPESRVERGSVRRAVGRRDRGLQERCLVQAGLCVPRVGRDGVN